MLYGNSRMDIREVFFRAWQDYRQQQALQGVAKLIVAVALQHPEYHSELESPDTHQDKDYTADDGATNPFLHMGMHITIEEQLSTDRPQGISKIYQQLLEQDGDTHQSQHRMMDCLGETLWQAQRQYGAPDEQDYLQCLQKLLK